MTWETVMGLEVHAELSTKSKIFCGCSAGFGGEPNTHVCPVCSGMPGTLPKLNRSVIEYALRLGLALGCEITRNCKFDRKNYFYPDLPKAYQVSQLYAPICQNGSIEIETEGQKKQIRIREIHMEEDAGKLIHDPQNAQTQMDFNRCGVPLLEIVSQPDFLSANEVIAYLGQLRETLSYLDICDCKMQEGSLRVDVNLSVRQKGGTLGTRTEMKNLNSFKAISRAIEYEAARQIKILENGGQITQETRRWDDEKGESYGMRSKENAQDYRYFPEPDLLPLKISDEWLENVRRDLPELAAEKRERYKREYKLSASEASIITNHIKISNLFEKLSELSGEPIEAAHLITGVIMNLMNSSNTLAEDLSLDAKKLSTLISLVKEGKINRNAYKETAEAIFTANADPEKYVNEKGLIMLSDNKAATDTVMKILNDNPDAVADFKSGKNKAFGFLMGQAMRSLNGTGNPKVVEKILKEILDNPE